ncbi:2OG-Fe(II) oxygenase family protein [Sphingobium sp. CR2-8]|uniref:2OG-Fe(II) oxygenase n=1 Tax=Sphingobium sp. CR2-8 TaxID=1306534 RepID=UPI002DB74310|nr:2OG-Fe(II) oxygenase family protein [Sphingobium sp. CR2-8]MEC3912752.1 2OG-Fe(II) oxygenase family protein [Sphingobium sp. CR2-8]
MLAERFVRDGRVQIRNILTDQSARIVHDILARQTPWGLAWKGEDGPRRLRQAELSQMPTPQRAAIFQQVGKVMTGQNYGFAYAQYPLLDAYKEEWNPGSPQDLLLEHINDQPLMDLVRQVTDIPELLKADAQATFFGPNHFLAMHDDSQDGEGWRVAYVLNMCALDWRPDWGGYLLFYDEDGDVVAGFRPRFNTLNLFRVPQRHNVSFVPPFAPTGRFALTGWFRDK